MEGDVVIVAPPCPKDFQQPPINCTSFRLLSFHLYIGVHCISCIYRFIILLRFYNNHYFRDLSCPFCPPLAPGPSPTPRSTSAIFSRTAPRCLPRWSSSPGARSTARSLTTRARPGHLFCGIGVALKSESLRTLNEN